MKKTITLIAFLLSFHCKSQSTAEIAEIFLHQLVAAQYDSCQPYFDISVQDKINAGMIQQIWEKIPNYLGDFKSYTNIRNEKADTLEIILIQCAFEKTKLDLKLVFNQAQKIVGIFFVPPKSNSVYNVPEYYRVEKLYETKIPLKTGIFEMPGILCVPNNTENPPVVIFVAGSGPNDKDETIGPNKVFKDLALGLASNGIASYRYDKRTLAQASKMAENKDKVGLDEEVFEDVFSAIKLVRSQTATKSSKIFIVGHSLGAMCAPLIAKKSKEVSGIILMAGPARNLEDVILDQINYLSVLDSIVDDDEKKAILDLEKQIRNVKNGKLLKNTKPEDLPLNLTSYYWQSVKKYHQIETAKKIKQPILFLQGERDYQVTMTDLNKWKTEMGNIPKNKFITYPTLNHLFIKGTGKCNPSEYQISGNVDLKVVNDISDWIKNQK